MFWYKYRKNIEEFIIWRLFISKFAHSHCDIDIKFSKKSLLETKIDLYIFMNDKTTTNNGVNLLLIVFTLFNNFRFKFWEISAFNRSFLWWTQKKGKKEGTV